MVDWPVFFATTLAPVPWVCGWALLALLVRRTPERARASVMLWLLVAVGVLCWALVVRR